MNTQDSTLAARFFFKNCAVSLHFPGEIRISRNLSPEPGDIVLDRNFYPAESPMGFIGGQSDFYRFLDASSLSNSSLIKKMAAIGYLLCNKLRRGIVHRAFLCVNDDDEACCYGKSLFAKAVAQYCTTVSVDGHNIYGDFWLENVREDTQLLLVDDPNLKPGISHFFNLCTSDWTVNRHCLPSIHISLEKAPYMLITSNRSVSSIRTDGSFRRRFVVLEFSPFFGPENPIDKYLGGYMFHDWNNAQWHMFDNFMFYCVLEYLSGHSRGEDIFAIYK